MKKIDYFQRKQQQTQDGSERQHKGSGLFLPVQDASDTGQGNIVPSPKSFINTREIQ